MPWLASRRTRDLHRPFISYPPCVYNQVHTLLRSQTGESVNLCSSLTQNCLWLMSAALASSGELNRAAKGSRSLRGEPMVTDKPEAMGIKGGIACANEVRIATSKISRTLIGVGDTLIGVASEGSRGHGPRLKILSSIDGNVR
jgi:hypothetical protein